MADAIALAQPGRKWFSLTVLCLCEVAALGLWFSASAVVPALAREYHLGGLEQSLFTSAVQAGFVVGSVISAALGLADRLDLRRFFTAAALTAALANAAILAVEPGSAWVVVFRFITGMCMAGIYPVGMKLASTWANRDMGFLVGLLVGALTLGSASPHLFNALGGVDWRFTLIVSSICAAAAGVAINLAGLGPNLLPVPRFKVRYVLQAWHNEPLRLANFGYFGHMWELYAMWAWIGTFLQASFALTLTPESASYGAKLATFATVGIGSVGCILGGLFADRLGRTTLTMLAMAISGTCAIVVGFAFGQSIPLLIVICLVWGVAIVADSAQFSASIAELSEPHLVGTMLTAQTAVGFTLTLVSIHLMPPWADLVGWRYAFAPLAIGPFLGVWAMAMLRARPEAVRLANGRR